MFLDYRLGREDGLEWLREFKCRPDCPPTVIMTGEGNETVAVRAMKLGAADYLAKQRISGEVITRIVQEAMDARKEQAGSTVRMDAPRPAAKCHKACAVRVRLVATAEYSK